MNARRETLTRLGTHIERYMRAHSISRIELAAKIGVTAERIRQVMNNPAPPPFSMVRKFMDVIGFDAQEALQIASDTRLYRFPHDSEHAVLHEAPTPKDDQYSQEIAAHIEELQRVITDMGKNLYELKTLNSKHWCKAAALAATLAAAPSPAQMFVPRAGESARVIYNEPGGVWRLRWGMRPRDVRKAAMLGTLVWDHDFIGVARAQFIRPPRLFGHDTKSVRVWFMVDDARKASSLIGVEFAFPGTAYHDICAAMTNVYGETGGNECVHTEGREELMREEWKTWIGQRTKITVYRNSFGGGPWGSTLLMYESNDGCADILARYVMSRIEAKYGTEKEKQREIYD